MSRYSSVSQFILFFTQQGSVASAGAAIRWIKDNLKIIKTSSEIEDLVRLLDCDWSICIKDDFKRFRIH
jgi:glycerol kinase